MASYQQELALHLTAPYLDVDSLRSLALVSHNVSELVFPFLFNTMRPFLTSRLDSCDALCALFSQETRWKHAHLVRNITINVEQPRKSSPLSTELAPESIVADIINNLPQLQHVRIVSKLSGMNAYCPRMPARDFEGIASALSSSSRLTTLDIDGPWAGGWTCDVNSLRRAGQYVRDLSVTITALRDGSLYAALCSVSDRLERLNIRGSVDRDTVEKIVRALPRPDRLRSFRVEMRLPSSSTGWWNEPLFDELSGLEELEVVVTPRSHDYHNEEDSEVFNPLAKTGKDLSFHYFLSRHASLKQLRIRAGPNPFTSTQSAPAIITIADALDMGVIVDAAEEAHLPMAAHLEDAGFTMPEAFVAVNRARRARLVTQNAARVQAWAHSARVAVLGEAAKIGVLAPALKVIDWRPYAVAGEEDGDYLVRVAFSRPMWTPLLVSGGCRHEFPAKPIIPAFDLPLTCESG